VIAKYFILYSFNLELKISPFYSTVYIAQNYLSFFFLFIFNFFNLHKLFKQSQTFFNEIYKIYLDSKGFHQFSLCNAGTALIFALSFALSPLLFSRFFFHFPFRFFFFHFHFLIDVLTLSAFRKSLLMLQTRSFTALNNGIMTSLVVTCASHFTLFFPMH